MLDAVTLIFPPGSTFPAVAGQWQHLPDGTLRARYTLSELRFALEVADAIAQQPPLTPTAIDHILLRYDSYGDKWLVRTGGNW